MRPVPRATPEIREQPRFRTRLFGSKQACTGAWRRQVILHMHLPERPPLPQIGACLSHLSKSVSRSLHEIDFDIFGGVPSFKFPSRPRTCFSYSPSTSVFARPAAGTLRGLGVFARAPRWQSLPGLRGGNSAQLQVQGVRYAGKGRGEKEKHDGTGQHNTVEQHGC